MNQREQLQDLLYKYGNSNLRMEDAQQKIEDLITDEKFIEEYIKLIVSEEIS